MSYKDSDLGDFWHIPEDDKRFHNPEFVRDFINSEDSRAFSMSEAPSGLENIVTEKQVEDSETAVGGTIPDGPSVDLGERAIHLSNSLDGFLKANKLQSFNAASSYNQKISDRYSSREVSRIINSEGEARIRADEEFKKAFGSEALIAAGYDPEHIAREAESEKTAFLNTYVGPRNENRRKKLRKRLDEYKKEAK